MTHARQTTKLLATLSSMAVGMMLLASCGANSAPKTTSPHEEVTGAADSAVLSAVPKSLIDAAKQEGSLTVYTAAAKVGADAQAKAFTDKYGVKVDVVRMTGSQLDQRFNSEVAAGKSAADIVVPSNPRLIKDNTDQGNLLPLDKSDLPGYPWDYPKKQLVPEISSAAIVVQLVGIAYNSDLVPEAELPTSWEDIVDPKWRGKIGIPIPTSSLGNSAQWHLFDQKIGDGWLNKLGDQQLHTYAASAPTAAALAAGEISLIAGMLGSNIASVKGAGAHVGMVYPDFTTGFADYIAVNAKAKHPSAARLFTMYAMSKEGAGVLAKAMNSVSPYDTKGLPTQYAPLVQAYLQASDYTDDVMAALKVSGR